MILTRNIKKRIINPYLIPSSHPLETDFFPIKNPPMKIEIIGINIFINLKIPSPKKFI